MLDVISCCSSKSTCVAQTKKLNIYEEFSNGYYCLEKLYSIKNVTKISRYCTQCNIALVNIIPRRILIALASSSKMIFYSGQCSPMFVQ